MKKTEKPQIRWLEIEGVRFPVSPDQGQAFFVEKEPGKAATVHLYPSTCSSCGAAWLFGEPLEDCAPCPACLLAVMVKQAAGGCSCYWESDRTFMECEACARKRWQK